MTREERAITNLKQMCSDGRYLGSGSYVPLEVLKDFEVAIKALEQEPRKGKWLKRRYARYDFPFYVCSECNEEFSFDMETGISIDTYCYCPNCGARMIMPQESEENNGSN